MLDLNATINLSDFTRRFNAAVAAALQGATDAAVRSAADELRRRSLLQFQSEGSAYGTPWLPRKARNQNLPSRPLLFRTGRLRASYTQERSADHVEIIERLAGGRVLLWFGTALHYAHVHHTGNRFIPPRPVLTPELLQGVELQWP